MTVPTIITALQVTNKTGAATASHLFTHLEGLLHAVEWLLSGLAKMPPSGAPRPPILPFAIAVVTLPSPHLCLSFADYDQSHCTLVTIMHLSCAVGLIMSPAQAAEQALQRLSVVTQCRQQHRQRPGKAGGSMLSEAEQLGRGVECVCGMLDEGIPCRTYH